MKQLVADLMDKGVVDTTFMVKDKVVATAKNGKPYMNVRLVDKSGEVDGKVWDNVEQLSTAFVKDDFIHVRGTASQYMGKMQVTIKDIVYCKDSDVNLADFMAVSPIPQQELIAELLQVIKTLENPYLRALMQGFVKDAAFLSSYASAPAAKGMHHVYLGGLLEHSLSVVRLVDAVVPLYGDMDRDLLVVGALLHDVGKVLELRYERSFDYTNAGRLIGHITLGVEMVTDQIRRISGFPDELAMLVKHMLLSHHGQYEYGSPKRPKTVEAVLLHYLDDMDSKVNGVRAHIARERDGLEGNWTSFHRMYNLNFYVPDEQEVAEVLSQDPAADVLSAVTADTHKESKEEPLATSPNLSLFE